MKCVLSAWLVPLPPSGFLVLLAGFEPAPPSYLGLSAVMVGKRLSHRSSVVHARVQQITGIFEIHIFPRAWGASGVA